MLDMKKLECHYSTQQQSQPPRMRMEGKGFLLAACVAVLTLPMLTHSALAQLAQSNAHANHAQVQPLVDGSVDPELIPDELAIRVLMQTLRTAPDPDADALKRLHARISRMNLSEGDVAVLVRRAGIVEQRAKDQEARIDVARPASASDGASTAAVDRYVEEQRRLTALLVDQYERLLGSLSAEGAKSLRDHILHIKSTIIIYPRPDMSPQEN